MFRRLPRFEYLAPRSVEEACSMLAQHDGKAKVIAGGTDLVPQMKWGGTRPGYVIGLSNIRGLAGIKYSRPTGLTLGALTTIRAIEQSVLVKERFPLLAQAASVLGSIEVRNRGTIGGNLCNAAPSADMAPSLIALGAQVKMVSDKGERVIPLEDFFQGPGKTVLGRSEVMTQIVVPNQAARSAGVYLKLTKRNAMDLPIVGVAVLVTMNPNNGTCQESKIVLGAVAPTPMRAKRAERELMGRKLDDAVIEKAAQSASREAKPRSTIRGSEEYKREMVKVLTRQAIKQALEQVK